ncbi:sensor histidine kinase [Catalinimonas niigatensis]|uniref:sensor histidine kinase n=1 Tax=Catalinimonas niigatensis TaxID=1397264 RepID=UPI002666005D|nr:sensor histidine kinase [Catalinimonas niigatensis]WPP48801.1 sensor histidine kinase [Catalinimonas niigatensis]
MQVFSIIQQNKELILKQWLAIVKEQIPAAKGQSTPALRNDVPDLLEEIITILDETTPKESLHESIDHGRLRATVQGYKLSHVIKEYYLLQQVIFAIIDKEGSILPKERNKILTAVAYAIEHASQAFYEIRQEEEIEAKHHAEDLANELREEGQLRDDFIGTLTHDLRSPLSNTHNMLELIKVKLSSDPIYLKHLNAIQLNITKADRLIGNLLDVNLIKSGGKLPIHRQKCDLSKEMQTLVEEFTLLYSGTILLEDAQGSLEGNYDCKALRQAIDNLLQNAIKYGDKESTITVKCQRKDGDYIELSVHNYGNPIPIDQQAKIFTRYYRIDNQSYQKGWGIGLSLVKGIVEAHDGKLDLTSSSVEGTTFSIKLPNS